MKGRVLLLQGPVGGYFSYLQRALECDGFKVVRLAFNGGDWIFSSKSTTTRIVCNGEDYRSIFARILSDVRPDALVLFGDERPVHKIAIGVARERGIQSWCFEEGYVRPDYVTFEKSGNNANSLLVSTFNRDACQVAPVVKAPRLRGQTRGMVLSAIGYFVALRLGRPFFKGYTHHRERPIRHEIRYWLRSLYRRVWYLRHDAKIIHDAMSRGYGHFYVLALQVHDDLQLRKHGSGWRVMSFTHMVLESFKAFAPSDCHLVIKAHPLDLGHGHHRKNIRRLVERSGIGGRVHFLQTGPVLPIMRKSCGVITINSTVGLSALSSGIPVMAFGKALYQIDGLSTLPSSTEDLNRFWINPPSVDRELAIAFRQHILNTVLIQGSFYVRDSWPALTKRVCSTLDEHCRIASMKPVSGVVPTPTTAQPGPERVRRSRVGIASSGIWRQREMIATLIGAEPIRVRRRWAPSCDLIVGWGHKATAVDAQRVARRQRVPYVAIEDGFLRSVRPGTVDPAIGWVVDRQGIYYDAAGPSDFETAVRRRASQPAAELNRAAEAIRTLRSKRLSKYNHGRLLDPATLGLPYGRDVVLVADQTFEDASVAGAGADASTFAAMLDAAIRENPDRTIAVKLHPETVNGSKRGYLAETCRGRGVVVIDQSVNPWCLLERAVRVYTVSSQIGLEALIAGVPVTCFGQAAYAGWGLTDDRCPPIARRTARPSLEALVAAAYFDYCRWLDPYTGEEIPFEIAVERLTFLRDRFHENRRAICVGFSTWKRRAVRPFLEGVDGPPLFAKTSHDAIALAKPGTRIIVWGNRRCPDLETLPGCTLVRAEDGFLRSVGLGAAFVKPASLVFDPIGIYYDPSRPSAFEVLAETTTFDDALLQRARRLREQIVARGLSKYNEGSARPLDLPRHKMKILVPGQVEDDASILAGTFDIRTNLDLLRRVRERWPDAYIIYKPHPDVQAGFRKGKIPKHSASSYANRIVTDVSIAALLGQVDRVATMTSLVGFEALLHEVPTTTYGCPFYSGWGLTNDHLQIGRRQIPLTLDELTAVALILLPMYIDPFRLSICNPELLIKRFTALRQSHSTIMGRGARLARNVYSWIAHNAWGKCYRALAANSNVAAEEHEARSRMSLGNSPGGRVGFMNGRENVLHSPES